MTKGRYGIHGGQYIPERTTTEERITECKRRKGRYVTRLPVEKETLKNLNKQIKENDKELEKVNQLLGKAWNYL